MKSMESTRNQPPTAPTGSIFHRCLTCKRVTADTHKNCQSCREAVRLRKMKSRQTRQRRESPLDPVVDPPPTFADFPPVDIPDLMGIRSMDTSVLQKGNLYQAIHVVDQERPRRGFPCYQTPTNITALGLASYKQEAVKQAETRMISYRSETEKKHDQFEQQMIVECGVQRTTIAKRFAETLALEESTLKRQKKEDASAMRARHKEELAGLKQQYAERQRQLRHNLVTTRDHSERECISDYDRKRESYKESQEHQEHATYAQFLQEQLANSYQSTHPDSLWGKWCIQRWRDHILRKRFLRRAHAKYATFLGLFLADTRPVEEFGTLVDEIPAQWTPYHDIEFFSWILNSVARSFNTDYIDSGKKFSALHRRISQIHSHEIELRLDPTNTLPYRASKKTAKKSYVKIHQLFRRPSHVQFLAPGTDTADLLRKSDAFSEMGQVAIRRYVDTLKKCLFARKSAGDPYLEWIKKRPNGIDYSIPQLWEDGKRIYRCLPLYPSLSATNVVRYIYKVLSSYYYLWGATSPEELVQCYSDLEQVYEKGPSRPYKKEWDELPIEV